MMDRFNNPTARPFPPNVPFDDPNYSGFRDGKFTGVRQQLPYLKRLGAGALWLSPVLRKLRFDDGSYHGYGIHDFLSAEPRFADSDRALRFELEKARKQAENAAISLSESAPSNASVSKSRVITTFI